MTISQSPFLAAAALLSGGAAAVIDYFLGYSFGPIGVVLVLVIVCGVVLEHKTNIISGNT